MDEGKNTTQQIDGQCSKHCPALKEYVVKLRSSESKRLFIVSNLENNPGTRLYTAVCPCCGKGYSKRLWQAKNEGKLLDKLRRFFRQCRECKQWVCLDCYCVWTGQDSGESCAECAKKSGSSGLNAKQYRAYRKEHPQTPDELKTQQQTFLRWAHKRQAQIDGFLAEFDPTEPIWGGNSPADEG